MIKILFTFLISLSATANSVTTDCDGILTAATYRFRAFPLALQPAKNLATWQGKDILLTEREFEVLSVLAGRANQPQVSVDLAKEFWPDAGPLGVKNLRVIVVRLEDKFKAVDSQFQGFVRFRGRVYWTGARSERQDRYAIGDEGQFSFSRREVSWRGHVFTISKTDAIVLAAVLKKPEGVDAYELAAEIWGKVETASWSTHQLFRNLGNGLFGLRAKFQVFEPEFNGLRSSGRIVRFN